jgi:hypothetical protein
MIETLLETEVVEIKPFGIRAQQAHGRRRG